MNDKYTPILEKLVEALYDPMIPSPMVLTWTLKVQTQGKRWEVFLVDSEGWPISHASYEPLS